MDTCIDGVLGLVLSVHGLDLHSHALSERACESALLGSVSDISSSYVNIGLVLPAMHCTSCTTPFYDYDVSFAAGSFDG